ncbi:MAG TPA: tetratricopeptide repeat protein [Tepidisphaeraceae bacterium]|nr:tetratricopeptide repeat protein [Tepidisphaeraceae bacterium]
MGLEGMRRTGAPRLRLSFYRLAFLLFFLATPVLAQDEPGDAEPREAGKSAEVDAPTKKLMAAHGLFQRGLFKLAAQEYDEFLSEYARHSESATARYASGVCRYRMGEHEKAIGLLTEAIKDSKLKQRDEALAVVGHCYLARKNYDKALQSFDEILAKHGNSKHAELASLNRAQVFYLADKKEQSLEAAKSFLAKYPDAAERPTGLYFMALASYGLQQPEFAAKTLSQLLREHGQSRHALDATLLLGQCLEATGDLDGAAEQYRRFIEIAPPARKGDGQYSLGVALHKSGRHDDAARELSRLISENSKSTYAAAARLQLGLVQLAAGKTREARRTLEQVAAQDAQRRNDARYGIAQCDIAEKKFQQARSVLDELAGAEPAPANLPQVLLDRAICAAELNQHEQAVAELQALLSRHEKSPQAAEATYRQAFSLHKLGKYDESRQLSSRVAAMKDSPLALPAAELDAENLLLSAKYADAAKSFERLAQSAKDEDRRLRWELRRGQCAYFSGDYEGAARLLAPIAEEEKVAQSPELQQAIFLLGDALLQQKQHAEAAEALARYVRVAGGDKREAQFKLALAQLRSEQPDDAERTLAQLAAQGGDSPWVQRALLERGQLLYKKGQKQQAADSLNNVLASNAPEELAAPALYLLGWVDFDAKRHAEAARRFNEVVRRYPKHGLAADAQFQQGVALKEAENHEEAIAAFKEYVQRDGKGQHVAKARQLMAQSLAALNRHEQAEQMLATLASDTEAASDTVLYDLAWAQRNRKDAKAAAATYRRLLEKHPDSKLAPAARAELAEFLYADGDFAEAAELLEAVVQDEKAEPQTLLAARYRLGWCYEKLRQPEKAGAILAEFVEKHGDSELAGSAMLQAGLSLASAGRFEDAAKSLSQMVERFPDHKQASVALLKLGEVQAEAEDYDASRQTFDRFLQKYGNDPLAYRARFGIGWAHEHLRNYDEARKTYKQVIDITNTETAARAQFQIGETYAVEGKYEEAVAALLAVEDVYAYPKWSARALLEAGRVFEQMKQPEEARKQYEAVNKKYKDAPEAALAGERLRDLQAS